MAGGGPGFEYFVYCRAAPCADESERFDSSCERESGLSILLGYGHAHCLWASYMRRRTGNLLTVAWIYAGVSLVNFIVGRWLMAYVIQLDMKVYLKTLGKPLS